MRVQYFMRVNDSAVFGSFLNPHVPLKMRKWMGILLAAPKLPLPPWASPFPHFARLFDLFNPDKRGPQGCILILLCWIFCIQPHLLVFITIARLIFIFFRLCKTGGREARFVVRMTDALDPASIIFFVNKMRIFHPNPTRSLVIVTQSDVSKKNGFWSVLFSSLKLSHPAHQ